MPKALPEISAATQTKIAVHIARYRLQHLTRNQVVHDESTRPTVTTKTATQTITD